MSIEGKDDLDGLREAGRVVRATLDAMEKSVHPGVTTAEVNAVGAAVLAENGARSGPMLAYNYPTETCISVNDEVVHGIPSARVLRKGDLVTLDVVAEKRGYLADAAVTVAVGNVSEEKQALIDCSEEAFWVAMDVARAGRRVNHIGRAVSHRARQWGFAVVKELAGHGVGRAIHEAPTVPNFYDRFNRDRLTEGLVITVEPMVTAGSGAVYEADDGWTIRTDDRACAAHFEHTIVITKGRPLVLTATATAL